MSTCTPVVYNGRAYIGVSGTGQFTPYSGHNITVIDPFFTADGSDNNINIICTFQSSGEDQTTVSNDGRRHIRNFLCDCKDKESISG